MSATARLDANTWTNNHTAFTDPFSGDRLPYTPKTWTNNNQYTISYGGPIRIPHIYDGRNKTFFFALWDQNISNSRDLVLHECSYRYGTAGNFPLLVWIQSVGMECCGNSGQPGFSSAGGYRNFNCSGCQW